MNEELLAKNIEINEKMLLKLSSIEKEFSVVRKNQLILAKALMQIQTQQEEDKEEIMKRVVERSVLVMRSVDLSLKEIFGKEKFTDLTADLASAFTSLWERLNKMQNDIDVVKRHI